MFAKKRIIALALATVVGASMFLTSCAAPAKDPASSGNEPGTTSSEGTTTPEVNDVLKTNYPGTSDPSSVTINISSEPPELNSILTTDSVAMSIMRDTIFGLTTLDENNNPVPGIAESWEISEDKTVYTFKLRQNAKWSNGDPVTANDFYFAISTHFTPETAAPYASTWAAYVKGANELMEGTGTIADLGVKAIDDYTLEITLVNPCTYFLSITAFANFLPVNQKFYETIGADAYGKDADKILTNGPYLIESWAHEDTLVLAKNPDFYDADKYSSIEKINMKMISDSNAAVNSFQAGEMDMIGLSTGEQVKLFKDEGINPPQYEDGTPGYIEFNTIREGANGKAMAQKEVRQALTLALDVQSYITNIAQNSNKVANTFTPNVVNGANGKYGDILGEVLKRPTGDYSEVKATFEAGLAKAGVAASDLKLSILTDEGDSAQKMCAFFQQQWKENLGIDVEVVQKPFKARLADQSNGEFDMCFALWGPDYNDAMTYLDMFITGGGNNHTGWSNATYDKLIADALVEGDAAKREGLLLDAEKLLLDEMPVGPVYHRVRDYICSAKLSGVIRNAFQEIGMRYAVINN